jgi:hypothetical protein
MRALLAALMLIAAPTLAACAPRPAREPALWRVTDSDSEIWLFGTAHMLRPELRWRGPRVNAAFAAAEEFVTETDTSAEGAEAAQALSGQLGMLPAGETLSSRLNAEQQARLARAASELRIDPSTLELLRPWLAALRLSYAYALSRGMRPEAGVESVLSAEARARGKRLSFLETPEQQVRFLADLAPAEEARFLADTLREIETDAGATDEMEALWARGDVEALAALFDAQWRAGSPALHEAIILERNRVWAEQIARRLKGEGRVFVAVGAAHLVGEGNVVALLRERGIDVDGP